MPLSLSVSWRIARGAAGAAAWFALAGCATGLGSSGPADSPVAVPATWTAAPAGAASAPSPAVEDLAQWWSRFNDPWLTTQVERALREHTSVRLAQAALQQSRAQRDITAAGNLPAVRASGSAQRSQSGDSTPANTFRAGFDASWEPDVFGARRMTQAASEAEVRAAQAAVAQARVSLASEVALNVIDLRGLALRERLARENLARQLEALSLTEWRVQAGLASTVDLAQARTTVEQTRAALPSLQSSLQQTLNALAVLTGQPPGALQQDWAAQPEAGVPKPPQSLALRFPADTLRQRPDVRAAQERVQAAWARVQQADANRYPSFSLGGSLGLSAPRLSDLFDATALTRSLLASVSASLFDGGALQAQVRVQQAALEQAQLNHEAAVQTALLDVENALVALQANRERLARLQAAAAAAAEAEWLARQRYTSGLIDYRSLLDTQRTLLSAQSELASAEATASADHVRLYKALGGGWQPEPAANDTTAPVSNRLPQ